MFNGKINYFNGPCSIAMLNYQRVSRVNSWCTYKVKHDRLSRWYREQNLFGISCDAWKNTTNMGISSVSTGMCNADSINGHLTIPNRGHNLAQKTIKQLGLLCWYFPLIIMTRSPISPFKWACWKSPYPHYFPWIFQQIIAMLGCHGNRMGIFSADTDRTNLLLDMIFTGESESRKNAPTTYAFSAPNIWKKRWNFKG